MEHQKIENTIVDAIELVTNDKIAKANFDKTITATIISCVDITKGIYNIKYQDAIMEAFSSPNAKYDISDSVYVMIPQNNLESDKLILCKVDGNSYNGANEKELTKAEYDALSIEERNNGFNYYVIDEEESGNYLDKVNPKGEGGLQLGNYCIASGANAIAIGTATNAVGTNSFACGAGTTASGDNSHVEGAGTKATGEQSHTEGGGTRAIGTCSHAEGANTTASGLYTHAEGYITMASGNYSHTEGQSTTASGSYSHAGGLYTIANQDSQTAIGKFNSTVSNALFIVGNGNTTITRSNAFEVYNNGSAKINGDLTVVYNNTQYQLSTIIQALINANILT